MWNISSSISYVSRLAGFLVGNTPQPLNESDVELIEYVRERLLFSTWLWVTHTYLFDIADQNRLVSYFGYKPGDGQSFTVNSLTDTLVRKSSDIRASGRLRASSAPVLMR